MSRTVIDIIKRAYKLIGVYSIGETPTADESIDGLTALNAMLDEWATESLMTYVKTLDTITLTPNTSVYTIGPTGTTVAGRPEAIDDSSYIDYLGVSYPLTVVSMAEYNAITLKTTTTTMPCVLWYKDDFPNGTVTLWPTPTVSMSMKLWSIKPLGGYLNLTDVVTLPPAYENAITFNLAMALAMEFNAPIPAMLAKNAVTSKKKIKRINYEPLKMGFRGDIPSHGVFNVFTGMVQ
jgi:hypothetical protein